MASGRTGLDSMGETENGPFQLSFNASLKVDCQGSRVTSDGGLILVRELDERLGFGELIEQHLTDSRRVRSRCREFRRTKRNHRERRQQVPLPGHRGSGRKQVTVTENPPLCSSMAAEARRRSMDFSGQVFDRKILEIVNRTLSQRPKRWNRYGALRFVPPKSKAPSHASS